MLVLSMKKKWFDMVQSGVKKEEYREVKSFWGVRLSKYVGHSFFIIKFVNGYGKKKPHFYATARLEEKPRIGKEEWGAKKNQKYFVIRILDIIKKDEVESLDSMVQFS